MKKTDYPLAEVVRGFYLHGKFLDGQPYGSGHINDTFCLRFDQAGREVRYILQRINQLVFRQPRLVMENIQRVTEWSAGKLGHAPHSDARGTLALVPGRAGEAFWEDAAGNTWRCYLFIEGAKTYDRIENAGQAFQAAHAFGRFQELVSDLPGKRLHETIPNFHNTRSRYDALMAAVETDVAGRVGEVRHEIDFVRRREAVVDRVMQGLASGEIPERVTHNDTKLNNVMIDEKTQEAVCVIDLDTVMPGSALYDFGDMVRTATSPALEDERDLSQVYLQMPMFEALGQGYLKSAGDFLTSAEKDLLAFSGKLITLEIGIRFLTDYLQGDVYFKTHRDRHNLDRCRTQFKLVESIEAQETEMNQLIRSLR